MKKYKELGLNETCLFNDSISLEYNNSSNTLHRVLPFLDVHAVHRPEDSLCAYTLWRAMKVQVCVILALNSLWLGGAREAHRNLISPNVKD